MPVCGSGAVVSAWSLLIRRPQRACRQAETPLIVLCRFPGPALYFTLRRLSKKCRWKKAPAIDGQGPSAPPSRVIPVSLLIEHDCFIHFDERLLDHRLRQSVPLQYLIIERHQHFELCERCLPKVLV